MNKIISFFKTNKAGVSLFASAFIVLALATLMTGCTLGDVLKQDVPRDMIKYNDGKDRVSLNDAPFVLEEYLAGVERTIREYAEDNERGHLILRAANSLLTVGVKELGSSPVPGATMFAGLLAGFGGLMIKKPGTAREVADEKMKSFNKGQSVALEQIKSMLTPEKFQALLDAMKGAKS